MTYELAKELKDAGFPQKNFATFFLEEGAPTLKEHDAAIRKKGIGDVPWTIAVPTLEELIEACGDDFAGLVKSKIANAPKWGAQSRSDNLRGGNTPSEAVARLWLALNLKNSTNE